jgi:hypothetical protein
VTDDIHGASPGAFRFKTNRSSNPLNPEYKLQTVTYLEPDKGRFLRDTLEVKDITDARTLGTTVLKSKHTIKDTMKISDIAGAASRPR